MKASEESVKEKKVFFRLPPPHAPHAPFVSKDFEERVPVIYGDVIEEIDYNTGRVLDALKEHGVYDNTHYLHLR